MRCVLAKLLFHSRRLFALVPEAQRLIDHGTSIGAGMTRDVCVNGADEVGVERRSHLDPAATR